MMGRENSGGGVDLHVPEASGKSKIYFMDIKRTLFVSTF